MLARFIPSVRISCRPMVCVHPVVSLFNGVYSPLFAEEGNCEHNVRARRLALASTSSACWVVVACHAFSVRSHTLLFGLHHACTVVCAGTETAMSGARFAPGFCVDCKLVCR